jgi:hypothetical protein
VGRMTELMNDEIVSQVKYIIEIFPALIIVTLFYLLPIIYAWLITGKKDKQ